MATTAVSIEVDRFCLGLSWDANETGSSVKPVDLDLACLAIDPTGLIMDACFCNNPAALGGAMVHSGDSQDGAATGVDEHIGLTASLLPPYTYAVVFVALCNGGGDFGACKTAQLHCFANGQPLLRPVGMEEAAAAKATVVVLAVMRRAGAGSGLWQLEPVLQGFPAPAKSFMDVYPQILSRVAIDPVMAEELKGRQPVFNLKKGESVNLPVGLTKVMFGLGWDAGCDVDASCVGLRAPGDTAFTVYFGSRVALDGVVVHSGDNVTGAGDGDDEQIVVDLSRMPADVDSLFFTVNVFSSDYDFTHVRHEFCRLVDAGTGREMVRFGSMDSGRYNGMVMVALYRNLQFPQQWSFRSVGLPAKGRTVSSLVDECQALQRSHRTNTPLPAELQSALTPLPAENQSAVTPLPAENQSAVTPLPAENQSAPDRTSEQKGSGGCCVVQ